MRLGSVARCLLFGAAICLVDGQSQAQFNPAGRHRNKPRAHAPVGTDAPNSKPKATSRPATNSAEQSPDALILRYTGIVLSQPEAQFPIRRLSELYRQRDGKIDTLVAEFEARARVDSDQGVSALVALAGIFRQAGNIAQAQATYEQAILKRPEAPGARLALADLFREQGDWVRARQGYEASLKYLTNTSLREQTLRTLLTLCLDLEDYACATEHHRGLVKIARGSAFVESELARELFNRAKYDRAVEEYRRVVRLASGDNRALLPALRDLGRALAKAAKTEEALLELRRALGIAGQSGVVSEIYATLADIYRSQNRLPELIHELEARPVTDFDRRKLLAELYEETGQLALAQKTYAQLASERPRDVSIRLKLIGLRELSGDLKGALTEYEKLVRAEPKNPAFVFRMVEALLQQGERARAQAELQKLEQRARGDDQVLTTLVDLYERLGDPARATQILERITAVAGRDPRHLVELGRRYWEADDKNRAIKTWKLVEHAGHAGTDRAANLLILGDVYLQHELTSDAFRAYREARKLKPNDRSVDRAYALALERAGAQASAGPRRAYYEEANGIWFGILKLRSPEPHLAREARQHIVTLWSLDRSLPRRPAALRLQLEHKPPDLEAGKLLAEVELKLGQPEKAEATLRQLVRLAPGDVESWATLERTLVKLGRLADAILTLEQLVVLDPANARQSYQRMAEHATALYRDVDALRYAARALELNPDDAEGHRRLGEMYRKRNLPEKAIEAFRKAIAKNDRLFPVYFELAELLMAHGQTAEADRLMRRVMRSAVDSELVSRAVRLSAEINVSAGTLPDLEHELFQVALGRPNTPLYRELLVEIYGALTAPLISGAASANADVRAKNEHALAQIGERAIKPLLDALNDPNGKQRQFAIELLSHLHNPGAGPSLITFATGDADVNLRTRAMLAAAGLHDIGLLPRFKEVLYREGRANPVEGDPVSIAAVFAVATLNDNATAPLLLTLLSSESPSARALAVLGLGSLKYRAAVPLLVSLCRSAAAGPLVQRAATRALAQIGEPTGEAVLKDLVWSADAGLRQSVLIALGSLSKKADPTALAPALLDPNPKTREAAKLAVLLATTRRTIWPALLPTPAGARVDVAELLDRGYEPLTFTNSELATAFVWASAALTQVATTYAQSSLDGARTVAASLGGTRATPFFLPLLNTHEGLSPDLQSQVNSQTHELVRSLVEPFSALAGNPATDARQLSLEFLGRHAEDSALAPVIKALTDPKDSVRMVALSVLGERKIQAAAVDVASVLSDATSWALRLRAAQTLKLLGSPAAPGALRALRGAAEEDRYALVRGASLEALNALDPAGSLLALRSALRRDPDEEVRNLAKSLLKAR